MIRTNTVLQFGSGLQWLTYIVDYTDLAAFSGSGATQVTLKDASATDLTLPQGSRVLGWRVKGLVKPAGASLSNLTVGLGWTGSVTAINGSAYDTFVTVADSAEQSGLLTATNAPGDAAWQPMANFTQTGMASWSIMTAGSIRIDLWVLVPTTPGT